MTRKILLLAFGLLVMVFGHSQSYTISGRVLDSQSGQTLAFVNIVANNSRAGTSTDIDGRFTITANEEIEFLRLSYVGYAPATFYPQGKARVEIVMEPLPVTLEVVEIVAGENPANRIIRNVIKNRDANDPEKLASFSYTSYDKMIFTVDTLDMPRADSVAKDSSEFHLRQFLSDKDFFMMETVSERKFMAPDKTYEKVVASRISGFRDPVLLFLSSQLQSSTFYQDLIRIGDKNYINPISGGSLRKYYFQLMDTTYTAAGDTVFVIYYRPWKDTNFDGLRGVLSINTHGWAIQSVQAEPARDESGMSIRIQHLYTLIDGEHWFPYQLNTDIIFKNVIVNNVAPIGRGKSYIRDVVLEPELVRRQFNHIAIDFDPRAGSRSEAFWQQFRTDSLSQREQRTYFFMDSVGKEFDLDAKAKTFKAMLNSRLPLGYVDLDLSKIIKYNQYQGLYLGLGLITNAKLSQTFDAEAFWGYGFGNQRAQYGGRLGVVIDKYRDLRFDVMYYDFVTETGATETDDGGRQNLLNPANFRYFLIRRMNPTQRIRAAVQFRALRYANVNLAMSRDVKQTTGAYSFLPKGDAGEAQREFTFTELQASLRYAYKEKFMQMPDGKMSLGTRYPIIHLAYTRGLDDVLEGDYFYNKVDLKISKQFYIRYLGESSLTLMAGAIDQPLPESNLYNGRGAFRTFTLYAPESFATQHMNEFMNDRYLFLFYTHNFGKLLWRTNKFSPEFAIATNAGTGSLQHPEYHQGITVQPMDHLYLESGLLINNMLNTMGIYSFGIGVFYRYGYYELPDTFDNFAFKLSIAFSF